MTTLQLITHSSWMEKELDQGYLPVNHTYGFDVPDYSSDDAWWMPQAKYVEIVRAVAHYGEKFPLFYGPANDLLSCTIPAYVGRNVKHLTVDALKHSRIGSGWWKLATAKNDRFPAERRSQGAVEALCEELGLSGDTALQWSSDFTLDIHSEHRFFTMRTPNDTHNHIAAESTYLIGGQIVGDVQETKASRDALTVARRMVQELMERMEFGLPPAVVIDVAVVEGFDFKAYVLEYNPVWCSAWYNADVNGVERSIERATRNVQEYDNHVYIPDPSLVALYGNPQRRLMTKQS